MAEDEELPEGIVARIDVTKYGVKVRLVKGMPGREFAALLHKIARQFEKGTIQRTE